MRGWGAAGLGFVLAAIVAAPAAGQQGGGGTMAVGAGGPEMPLWEAGLFAGVGWIASYPAASDGQVRVLPVPYLIYRGDTLRIGDRGAVRARETFLDSRLELDVGIGGAFDVNSDEVAARRGMPDLDYLLELGPQAILHLRPEADQHQVDVALQLRGVLSSDFSNLRYQGTVLNPEILFMRQRFAQDDIGLYASLGLLWGMDGLNDYFYEVDPQFATATRPSYQARNGYLGTELTLGLGYRVGSRGNIFVGGQLGYFGGSANRKSPLHRRDVNFSVGVGFAWSFLQSEQTAPVAR